MNVSDMNFSGWSTGGDAHHAADDKINAMKNSAKLTGFNGMNSSGALNESKVPSWDHADSWVQAECFKPATFNTMSQETDSCLSGSEGQPAWASTDLCEPAWASSESSSPWDHDKAQKIAEQLLPLQFDDSSTVAFKNGYNSGIAQQLSSRPIQHQIPQLGQHEMTSSSGLPGMANPRFKTEFCRNFREKGECVYGSQCQFAHGKVELRHDVVRHSKYKTKLCQKYWINGWCAYGTRCNFIHQEHETTDITNTQPVTQSGFRPLTGAHNFRKSSESSVDSGIDKCSLDSGAMMRSSQYAPVPDFKMRQDVGSSRPLLQSGVSKFQQCFPEPKMHDRDEMNMKFSDVNRNMNFSPVEMNSNMNISPEMNRNQNISPEMNRNMNLSSEMKRNLYLDIVKVKESRLVPHPEDNPIPASQYSFSNQTSDFRMNGNESVIGNLWTY